MCCAGFYFILMWRSVKLYLYCRRAGRTGPVSAAQRGTRHPGGGRAGRAEPKSALGASPLSSPVRQNIFLNLNSVPATPVNPGRVLGRREGSADIFGSLKSPLMDRGMESFALHGSGLGSSDFLMCTEDLN